MKAGGLAAEVWEGGEGGAQGVRQGSKRGGVEGVNGGEDIHDLVVDCCGGGECDPRGHGGALGD